MKKLIQALLPLIIRDDFLAKLINELGSAIPQNANMDLSGISVFW